jgi:hypothetical protein
LNNKLTQNQLNCIQALEDAYGGIDYVQLKEICDKYAFIVSTQYGYNPNGNVWKNEVSRCLQSLIIKGLVEYQYRGKYKLKIEL